MENSNTIERYLQPLEVIAFFLDNCESGRTSNHDLIKYFRPLLVESSFGKENHDFLKKITAQLVIVKKIKGNKYLELKPDLRGLQAVEIFRQLHVHQEIVEEEPKIINAIVSNIIIEDEFDVIKPRSRAPIYDPSSLSSEKDYFLAPKSVVQEALEQEKHEEIEQIAAVEAQAEKQAAKKLTLKRTSRKKIIKLAPISEEGSTTGTPMDQEDIENEVFEEKNNTLRTSRVSVKDLSRTIDELAKKELEQNKETLDRVLLRTRAHRLDKPKRRPSSDLDHDHDMGYRPLDDQTRAWILAGAKNDESKLRSLLNECPKICGTRDPTTGYTALHWMAKYGNDAMVHLLIGRYRMNPNIRTRGGYTPLMLAAMHRKENVYNLLLKPYGAEPNLRDYSGKKAEHYLPPEVLDEKEDEDEPDSKRKAKIDRSSTFLRDFVRESKRGLSRPKTQNL